MDTEPSCFPSASSLPDDGYLDQAEQFDRLQELRVSLNAAKEYNSLATDALNLGDDGLTKYLRSCKYDVDSSYERVMQSMKFRKEIGLEEMLENPEEFTAQDQWGSAYWHNTDRSGRRVLVLRVCRHDPLRFCALTTTRYLLWKFVSGIREQPSAQVALLVDYIGATRHNLDMKLLATIIPMFQQHFPDTLGNCFVYPTSFGFWMMWKMCSILLDENTVNKMVFLRESKRSKLLKFFEPDQLQERFGGTCPQEFGSEQAGNITGGGVMHGYDLRDEQVENGQGEAFDMFLQEQEDRAEHVRKLLKYKPDCIGGSTPKDSTRQFTDGQNLTNDEAQHQGLRLDSSSCTREPEHTIQAQGQQTTQATREVDASGSIDIQTDSIEAGQSLCLVKHDVVETEDKLQNSYATLDPRTFKVRCGPDYKRTKLKSAAKGPAVYDLVAVDIYKCERKVYNIGSHMQVPTHILPATKQQSKSGLPELLIINFQMPFYEPPNPVWGAKKDDGEGAFVIHFFRLSEWAAEKKNHPSVKLWSRFVHCHENDLFRDRMKFILSMSNPEELNLSRVEKALNSKYNAQPFLSRPEACFKGPGYFEMDIDCHKFCYLARKTGYAVLNRVNRMVLNFAAIIQAETNDEMPENILACSKLYRLDLKNASDIDIEFAVDGTPSPRKKSNGKTPQSNLRNGVATTKAIHPNPSSLHNISKQEPFTKQIVDQGCDSDVDDVGFHDATSAH